VTGRRRWGKAGVQLAPAEAASRDARALIRRAEADTAQKAGLERARRKWAEGMVIPHHITIALDAKGLYGPAVDEACGAREPDVDLWEAGKLYPSWEQIVKLAALTGKTPEYFMGPVSALSVYDTSMRFHVPRYDRQPLPVHRFTQRALARARAMGVEA